MASVLSKKGSNKLKKSFGGHLPNTAASTTFMKPSIWAESSHIVIIRKSPEKSGLGSTPENDLIHDLTM
ncbi:unnamed protein product [Sphenostylis stenocarpa]|uniref:Uncharacterized protein n=1 Tax=Sphenostylis stenocarpa TaxID=92480 RepID=A0AA86VG84_9FABA|nr:unnamed protein product [Sphenostylis stenocarpa]